MYKHLADSILESTEKIFISQSDKDKYDGYENIFISKEDTYSKEEIDGYMSKIEPVYHTFEGEFNNIENSKDGMIKDIEILGDSRHSTGVLLLQPTMQSGSIDDFGGENNNTIDTRFRTDFIEVQSYDTITYMNSGNVRVTNVFFYDSNKTLLTSIKNVAEKIEVPINCKYVRFYNSIENSSDIQIRIDRVNLNDIMSVEGEITIKACGKNLFDGRLKHGNLMFNNTDVTRFSSVNHIRVKPNTDYVIIAPDNYLVMACEVDNFNFKISDLDPVKYLNVYKFNTGNLSKIGIQGMNMEGTEITDLNIDIILTEVNQTNLEYEDYKYNMTQLELPYNLYGLKSYRDRLFKRNDTWYIERNVKPLTLTGEDIERVFDTSMGNGEYISIVFSNATLSEDIFDDGTGNTENSEVVNSLNIPYEYSENKINHMYIERMKCVLVLKKSDYNINDLTSAKQYFNDINFTFIRNLKQSELIKVDDVINPMLTSISGIVNVYGESTGGLNPIIKGKTPISIGGSIESTNGIIKEVERRVDSLKDIRTSSTIKYKSNKNFTVLEDVKNGVIEELVIKGNTLVNLNNGDTSSRLGSTNGYLWGGQDSFKYDNVKPNTMYTVFIFDKTGKMVSSTLGDSAGKGYFYRKEKGNVISFKTPAVIDTSIAMQMVYYASSPNLFTESDISRIQSVVVEGDYSHLDINDISYFEELKSVNQENYTLKLLSRNETKNLLNIHDLHNGTNTIVKDGLVHFINDDGNTNMSKYAYIRVEKGEKYYIKVTNIETLDPSHYGIIAIRDGDMSSDVSTAFISMKDCPYNRIYEITPTHNMLRLYITTEKQNTIGTFTYKISISKSGNTEEDYEVDEKEIVMVKDLVNIYDGVYEEGDVDFQTGVEVDNTSRYRTGFINVKGKHFVKMSGKIARFICYDANKNFISAQDSRYDFKLAEGTEYIRFSVIKTVTDISRLTVQAFSPIILRDVMDGTCDTIEKHSDGKWYYHKRCDILKVSGNDGYNWNVTLGGVEETGKTHRFQADLTNYNGIVSIPKKIKSNYPYTGYSTYGTDKPNIQIASSNDIRYVLHIRVDKTQIPDINTLNSKLNSEPLYIVYILKKEEVYEVTPLDLSVYEGETSVILDSTIPANLELSVGSCIGNTINSLKNKISNLEDIINEQNVSQNKFILSNTYVADTTALKVDIMTTAYSSDSGVNEDLFMMIYKNIIVGKENYNRVEMEEIIDFYTMVGSLDFDMAGILFDLIEQQHVEII